MTHEICAVDGCGRFVVARGWCSKHYQQWRATGDPLGGHGPALDDDDDDGARTPGYEPPPLDERVKLLCLAPRELEARARAAGAVDLADEMKRVGADVRNPRRSQLIRDAGEAIVDRLLEGDRV